MNNITLLVGRLRSVFYRYISTNLHTALPNLDSDSPIYDQLEREWASRWTR